MKWTEIETMMKGGFEVAIEIGSRNKYFVKKGNMYFPISSFQFDRLLEEGFVDPDYRVVRDPAYGSDQLIYTGR